MLSCDRGTGGLRAELACAVLLALTLCLLLAASASASAAAPNWLEPADLSKPGRDASNPQVAMDGAGNTLAVWERQSTLDPSFNTQMSSRDTGGTFTVPVDLAPKGTEPQLAMAPDGEAVAIWRRLANPPGVYVIEAATRPPGGSFSLPVTVHTEPATVIPQGLSVAIGTGGAVVVTWTEIDPASIFTEYPDVQCGTNPDPPNNKIKCPNPPFAMASMRPAGGVFTEAQQISPQPTAPPVGEPELEEWAIDESAKSAGNARPAMDAAGDATVIFSYFNGEHTVVESTVRPAGGEFGGLEQITAPGEDAGGGDIGIDEAGNAIATWLRSDGSDLMVQAAIKAPGGAFTPLGDVSPAGGMAERPVLGVAPNGTATVVWRLPGPTEAFVQSSTRPPGGTFSPPVNINSGKDAPLFHEVAVGAEGDAIVVWSGENGPNQIVRAAVRTAGASAFGTPVAISQSSPDLFHPRPSMDAGGDATVVWVRNNGTHDIVQWAGYDADPPQLSQVSIPSTAKVADTVQFSASASDVWPVGKPSFDFGDGGRADGNAVSHVYTAPGSYPVTVTVADAVGRTATSAGTILVKARNHFTIGKLKRNRRKGTATLTIAIPEPGTIVASGKGIKKATVRAAKGGSVKVPLKAVGGGLKRLKAKGKLKAKLKIAYSPVGGDTSIQHHRVTLQKKLG